MKNLFLLLAAALLFTTCRKGEDDPKISFQSRKSRVEGDWNIKDGSASLTLLPYNEYYTIHESDMTLYVTYTGGQPTIYVGKYRLTISCTKDGEFHFYENIAGTELEASGTWEFLGKKDDVKNKERIQFTIDKIIKGKIIGFNLFHQQSETFSYRLKELRKDRMVIVGGSTIDWTAAGKPVEFQAEYTLTQRDL